MSASELIKPQIEGVPETMLWTLHNRVAEANRPDGILIDPEALRIYKAIDYDFAGRFGPADGSHAVRALVSDRLLRTWIESNPEGTVVSLGEGLETQSRRVDNGRLQWITVDLPESIQFRETLLPPTKRFVHIACNALDTRWLEHVPRGPCFVVAQGLLMYFQPAEVRRLLATIARHCSGGEMFFDVLPPWFPKILGRFSQRRGYTVPPMPWGLDSKDVDTMTSWDPAIAAVESIPFEFVRGPLRPLHGAMTRLPWLRDRRLSFVHMRFARRDG